ncbi:hydrolase TatD [candidate division LCP-89 bacterium B3_LCP]|uniref:Hydrolase TatD n=1 Tax=candidate division LCP-89 bacterium B3_LCP TaxID=2012998 RepID=A0A532UXQ0_UNCL8|nr:MAG: hydrolase TatD [candidate division LCP-89 bacterium B3_LCP]
MYIDTHAHLDFPELKPHLGSVLSNAQKADVQKIITIGIDAPTNQNALAIAVQNEGIYASAGWHPHEAQRADDSLESHISLLAQSPQVVAIGEIGLDFYRNRSPHDVQQQVFRRMIRIAADLDLPVIVHCRDAFEDTISILKTEISDNTRGVFHCFAGDVNELQQVLDLGFHISYTGNITYKNTSLLPTVIATPLDRVMLETDCPFLTPHPHRGKRNEPAFIPLIAERIAEIKKISKSEVAEITTATACEFFGIK